MMLNQQLFSEQKCYTLTDINIKKLVLFLHVFHSLLCLFQLKICPQSARITIMLLECFAHKDDNKVNNLERLTESNSA